MAIQNHNDHILQLVQKWMTGIITVNEYAELDLWYRSLEDASIGSPMEMTIDRVEKRLHQQFWKQSKPSVDDPDCPPYPL